LVGLEFELKSLHLQSRCSTAWATTPVHFALVILEKGVSQTICLGWPQILTLPISVSQVGLQVWATVPKLVTFCMFLLFLHMIQIGLVSFPYGYK
jgi:hypothetical protein